MGNTLCSTMTINQNETYIYAVKIYERTSHRRMHQSLLERIRHITIMHKRPLSGGMGSIIP